MAAEGDARARDLAERVLRGETRAGARLMRLIDDEHASGFEALSIVHRAGPESHLIGVTGAPGTGKSSVIDQLIAVYRRAGKKVGVVAVDPSSPISGGAVLADRVRMQQHTLDEAVFVRSLSSRGRHGGLSASTSSTARIMEAMGFDPVIVETVGIGQSEVDVAEVADTVIAVLAPGLGDDVQAMKAGLLEVPDVFVVNKADREGKDVVVRDLESMLHLAPRAGFDPRVFKTIASGSEASAGIEALVAELDRHRAYLLASGELAVRRVRRARLDVETSLLRRLRGMMLEAAGGEAALDAAARRVALKASDAMAEVSLLVRGSKD